MSDLVEPFDFNPPITKANAAYTVPAGKYAIVTINLFVSAYGRISVGALFIEESSPGSTSADSTSLSFEVRIKAGDILAITKTAPTASFTTATASDFLYVEDKSIVSCTLDPGGGAVQIAKLEVGGAFQATKDGSVSSVTIVVDGLAEANFAISEYNINT